MSHVTIPREPTPSLLRPFIGCNTQELHEAWAAMVRIAEVEHTRSGSWCLAQIEEPAPAQAVQTAPQIKLSAAVRGVGVVDDCDTALAVYFTAAARKEDIRALHDALTKESSPQAAPALEAPAALSDAEIISAQELHYQAKLEAGQETVCTCPSGDGSLRWLCPTHPPERAMPAVPTPELQRMTAGRATYFMERFLREEKLLGPNEQAALRFVISQPDAYRTALHEISATGNLTATGQQFARHLQQIARDALAAAPQAPAAPVGLPWRAVADGIPAWTDDATPRVIAVTADDDFGGVQVHDLRASDFHTDGDGDGAEVARACTHWAYRDDIWPRANGAAPAAPAVDALDAADRECFAIGRAIQRAAGELPVDGEIRIDIENGAGAVYVLEPKHGDWRYIDSGDVLSAQINEAIDAANAAAKGAA